MRGRLPIPLLVCALALTLAGCGSGDDGTIPPDDANNLLNQVEAVKNDVESGDCETAKQHAQELVAGVNALPNDVDPDVASELTKAAFNLTQLASTDCEEGTSGITGLDTTETDTTATQTETTQPETTTTTTTEPETTTSTEEQPEEPPAPPGGGNEGGNEGGGNVNPTPGGGGLVPPSGGVEPGGGGSGGGG